MPAICSRLRTRSGAIARRPLRSAWRVHDTSKAACSPCSMPRATGASRRCACVSRGRRSRPRCWFRWRARRRPLRRRKPNPAATAAAAPHQDAACRLRTLNALKAHVAEMRPASSGRRRLCPHRAGQAARHVGNPSDRQGRHRSPATGGAAFLLRLEHTDRPARRADRRATHRRRRTGPVPPPTRCRDVHLRRRRAKRRWRRHLYIHAGPGFPGGAREARLCRADGRRAVPDGPARHRVCVPGRADQTGLCEAGPCRDRSRRSARSGCRLSAGHGGARLSARIAAAPDRAEGPRDHSRLRP